MISTRQTALDNTMASSLARKDQLASQEIVRAQDQRSRYQVPSTILTSQLPVSRWHEQIGDPTLADGILDRLVHDAHRIEMRGDSMRKNRGKPNA
jgi:DNA replication protein DnaC